MDSSPLKKGSEMPEILSYAGLTARIGMNSKHFPTYVYISALLKQFFGRLHIVRYVPGSQKNDANR